MIILPNLVAAPNESYSHCIECDLLEYQAYREQISFGFDTRNRGPGNCG